MGIKGIDLHGHGFIPVAITMFVVMCYSRIKGTRLIHCYIATYCHSLSASYVLIVHYVSQYRITLLLSVE